MPTTNSEICNKIQNDIRCDVDKIEDRLSRYRYTRASKEDIKNLRIARRRIRLAMNKLGISWR